MATDHDDGNPMPTTAGGRGGQTAVNARAWSAGRFLDSYDHSRLRPAEIVALARYRDALTGRVLDVGCGAGRMLRYLLLLGAAPVGIDISPRMVEHCRRRFPEQDIRVGDLGAIKQVVDGPFDAVLMADNVIDALDDGERRRALRDIRELLTPDGLLLFSSHNLDHWDRPAEPSGGRAMRLAGAAARHTPAEWVHRIVDLPIERRNRRRLAALQYRAADHAVINDLAHRFSLLHYYIGHAAQARQLSELGFTLDDVLEADGSSVAADQPGHSPWLYYVARPGLPGPSALRSQDVASSQPS